MRSLTHKRVFSAVLATGLAASALVALAASSDAATAKLKADATTSVGQKLTITGADLVDDNGVPQFDVDGIRFTTAACTTAEPAASASNTAYVGSATNAVAQSDTKVTLDTTGFTPTLSGGKAKYFVCVYDNGGTPALLGSSTTTFYAQPATIAAGVATLVAGNLTVGSTVITNGNYAASLKGSSLGGTKITAKGTDFTSKTYITVGGQKLVGAKTVLGKTSSDNDVITGTTPPGTSLTAPFKILGEFGTFPLGVVGVNSAAALTLAYTPTVAISPSGSDGTAGRVITLTGTGFNSLTLTATGVAGTAGGKSIIYILPSGLTLPADLLASGDAATPTGAFICTSPTVVSDTQITCAIPTIAALGGYSVVLTTYTGAATAQTIASSTGYSRGSAYTVAPF